MNLLPKKKEVDDDDFDFEEYPNGDGREKMGYNQAIDDCRLSLIKGLDEVIDKAIKHLRIVATIGAPGGLKIEGKEKFKQAIIKSIKETK